MSRSQFLHADTSDSLKLAIVIGHDDVSACKGVGGERQIITTDQPPGAFKLHSNLPIAARVILAYV